MATRFRMFCRRLLAGSLVFGGAAAISMAAGSLSALPGADGRGRPDHSGTTTRRWPLLRVAVSIALMTPLMLLAGSAAQASTGTSPYSSLSIGVGSGPVQVALDAADNLIYATNYYSDTVSVINGATNTVTDTIDVGANPQGITVDPTTDSIYVTNFGADTVSVINGATNAVVATIGVGTDPEGIAVDPTTDAVYVANAGPSSTVSVINGATNTVSTSISGITAPTAVAADPATGTVYVTSTTENTVSVITESTDTITATISIGCSCETMDPFAITVDPTTDTVFTANFFASSVSVISGATNTLSTTIATGSNAPYSVTANPTSDTVYIAGTDGVSAINGATDSVTGTIDTGTYLRGVAVDPTAGTVYATAYNSASVSVINQSPVSYPVTGTFPIDFQGCYGICQGNVVFDATNDTMLVGSGPASTSLFVYNESTGNTTNVSLLDQSGGIDTMVYDASNQTVYVLTSGNSPGAVIKLLAVSASTFAVTATLPVNGNDSLLGLSVNPLTGFLYLSDATNNTVSVINLANNSVVAAIAVGTAPGGSVVDTATDTVYVANALDNTLSVINGSTNTVVGTIPVGTHPVAIAIDPVTSTLYVSDLLSPAVSVVSESLGAVIATVDLGVRYQPAAIAVDPSLGTVYVGIDDQFPYVAVINAVSNTLTTLVTVGDSENGTEGTDGVAVDPSTHQAFVSTADSTGGTSPAAVIITPGFPDPPGAPTIGAASAGNGKATVAFSPPASDGGQNISSYTAIATDVTDPSRGGQTASGTQSPITMAGLTNGDTYTFTVTAANYAPGLPSGSSPAVVPVGVVSLSPATVAVGAAVRATFTGSGFATGDTITLIGRSSKFKATRVKVVSATSATATLGVPTGAATGAYSVKVADPEHGSSTCTRCLHVIAAPTLTAIAPSSVAVGTTTSATLTGSGFATGLTVKGPTGVTFKHVTAVNSTTITASMKVDATAPTGAGLPITVTNAAAGGGKATGAILSIT